MNWEKALNWFKENDNFLILTHKKPDLDGIGSLLAVFLFLKILGKRVNAVVEKLPEMAMFLPGVKEITLAEELKNNEFKALVVVDAHSPHRLPDEILKKIKLPEDTLVIDHHLAEDRTPFSNRELLFIDPSAPSTTFLLYKFFFSQALPLSEEIAQNLLAGIYYDTGGFRYENVGEEVFRVSAELVRAGAKPSQIAREIFENMPIQRIEFLKLILNRLEFLNNGKIVISYLTLDDFQKVGGTEYLNDLTSFIRGIKGVEVAVLVKELEKGLISVSLRSKSPVEVVGLAKKMGGGGHRFASGFKVENAELFEFMEKFKKELREYYGEEKR